jgi:hypothetical protein
MKYSSYSPVRSTAMLVAAFVASVFVSATHAVKYTQISAGGRHTCAVFPSGNGQCWGFGDNGELGDGNNTRTGIPRWVIETTCTLDLDGDGNVSALSDGVMFVRALLGFGGVAVTNDVAGGGVSGPTWAEIRPLLSNNCGLQGLAP